MAVASRTGDTTADLLLTAGEATGRPRGIRLTDVDVSRVARALALTRRAARRLVPTRWAGLALGALGVVLAAVGVLSPLLAVGYTVLACVIVTAVATRR